MQRFSLSTRKNTILTIIVIILILIGGYFVYNTEAKNKELQKSVQDLQEALKNSQDSLSRSDTEKKDLIAALEAEGRKSKSFANQIDEVTNTVETLQRLTKTDPELLQKYSKVYFLNENYTPSALTEIDSKYLYDKNKHLQFHDRAWIFLKKLLDDAQESGNPLLVISAYRSFGTQATLKSSYKVTYGAGSANSFSADQGYSEHQLGTTIDFTTTKVGSSFSGFQNTGAFTWLEDNAYKYGFILSYPKNNSYYVYEPWHWRFVGLDLATSLHNNHQNFYDLDQRQVSSYLANFFNGTTTASTN